MRHRFLLTILAGLFGSSLLNAQTTYASITGTITDSTGAIIANAEVSATNTATNITTRTRSTSAGVFTIPQLKEGEYQVQAQAPGFKKFVVEKVLLEARDYRRLDVQMSVGVVVEKVEITAEAALIETETARLTDTRTAQQLVTLPRVGLADGMTTFFTLTPGFAKRSDAGASFNGSRGGEAMYSIDGNTISDGSSYENMVGPLSRSFDWYQELRMDVGSNSAEFGTLANVTIVSKSGTNDLHGSAYDYYNSPGLRSREPFSPTVASGISQRFGATVGGPVYLPHIYNGENRTFFFVTYDAENGGSKSQQLNSTVPLEAWRNGDFSALGIPIRNPFTGEVYADGRIPASQINGVSKKIQERFYPLPNYGNTSVFTANNFRQAITFPKRPPRETGARLDHLFSEKDFVFARFTGAWLTYLGGSWDGNLPAFGERTQFRRMKSVTVSHTHTFSPTLVNEARFGYLFNNNPGNGPLNGLEVVDYLGLEGLVPNLPDLPGTMTLNWSGIGLRGLSQTTRRGPNALTKTFQIQDQISRFQNRHSMKAGFDLRRVENAGAVAGSGLYGNVTFANTYSKVPGVSNSGHPYADFLFGVPSSAGRHYPPALSQLQRWAADFFAQDDWKVTNRLTANLGVRYEYHLPWQNRNGATAMFDPTQGRIVVPDAGISRISLLMPASYVSIVKASDAGLPQTLVRTDTNNFAPRVGLAWRPFQNNNLVLRGGYGIYFVAAPIEPTGASVPPFNIVEPGYTNTRPDPTIVLPTVFPATGTGSPGSIGLPSAFNPNFKTPYSQQWSFTIEHQRWDMGFRASYIGTAGRQLGYSRDINTPVADDRLYIDKPRPFPQFPSIYYFDNGASHTYNALNIEVERKTRGGLYFQASHTWARDIGDAGEAMWTNIENPFDRRRERSVNTSVPTHRFSTAVTWDLPLGKQRKWLSGVSRTTNLLVGGWQLTLIGTLQTGQFLTPIITIPDPTGTFYTTGANRPLVGIRPDQLRDARLSNPTLEQWFDASAFAAPPIGRFGNSANGVLVGPGINVWHAGLQKYFSFSENPRIPKLRAGVTAENALNHPNWGPPDTSLSNTGTVGTITTTGSAVSNFDAVTARNIVLSLRAEW